jgi:hypothetical protein
MRRLVPKVNFSSLSLSLEKSCVEEEGVLVVVDVRSISMREKRSCGGGEMQAKRHYE